MRNLPKDKLEQLWSQNTYNILHHRHPSPVEIVECWGNTHKLKVQWKNPQPQPVVSPFFNTVYEAMVWLFKQHYSVDSVRTYFNDKGYCRSVKTNRGVAQRAAQ